MQLVGLHESQGYILLRAVIVATLKQEAYFPFNWHHP